MSSWLSVAAPPWRIGIDVGGTFTDVVVADSQGQVLATKTPSMPQDPSKGIMRALERTAGEAGLSLRELLSKTETLVHGSTVATNTVLEGKGARVGLLCTKGFRDALTIRRGLRANPWRHRDPFPPPLVPRHLRWPVTGRINPDGSEREALRLADVEAAVTEFEAAGIEALGISFLHAYTNASHEIAARDAVKRIRPDLPVFISSEVMPVVGEYARTSTTVAAAAVAPRIVPYLERLERTLAEEGYTSKLLLIQSNGGLITVAEVARNPACLILSGPSGGVGALRWLADATGRKNLITMEMGGTSCDLILMHEGRVESTDELEVAGYHLRVPAVDIHTVSAGGGSIARVDAGGVMTLGPDGAGSDPGPAAYGRGGKQATDTDAQLVLGRLPAGTFAGGTLSLDADRARAVIDERIALPLNVNVQSAAIGITRLQGQALVHAVEQVSIERGFDPRRFALVSVGGAAAVHAASIARRLGCREVLVPRLAGVFCAFGMLNADIRRDAVATFIQPVTDQSLARAVAVFAKLEKSVADALTRQDIDGTAAVFERTVDIRYPGQQSILQVPYSADAVAMIEAYEAQHMAMYGHLQQAAPEFVAVRVIGVIPSRRIPAADRVKTDTPEPAPASHRSVSLTADVVARVPVYAGGSLQPGHRLNGPLIVEEATTTVLVNEGDELVVESADTLVIKIGSSTVAAKQPVLEEVA